MHNLCTDKNSKPEINFDPLYISLSKLLIDMSHNPYLFLLHKSLIRHIFTIFVSGFSYPEIHWFSFLGLYKFAH